MYPSSACRSNPEAQPNLLFFFKNIDHYLFNELFSQNSKHASRKSKALLAIQAQLSLYLSLDFKS